MPTYQRITWTVYGSSFADVRGQELPTSDAIRLVKRVAATLPVAAMQQDHITRGRLVFFKNGALSHGWLGQD